MVGSQFESDNIEKPLANKLLILSEIALVQINT